jgi:hypothetical protein
MDQRARVVEDDLKGILRTRMALADKIDLLEQLVQDTVRGTRIAALETIDLARGKAVDFIECSARVLDPSVHAARRPWVMVGSAVAIGFLAGWIGQQRRRSGVYSYYPPKAHGAEVMRSQRQERLPSGVYPFYPARQEEPVDRPSNAQDRGQRRNRPWEGFAEARRQLCMLWDGLTKEWTDERTRLHNTALHMGRSFIRDLARIVGEGLIEQLDRSGSRRPGCRKS